MLPHGGKDRRAVGLHTGRSMFHKGLDVIYLVRNLNGLIISYTITLIIKCQPLNVGGDIKIIAVTNMQKL